MVKAESMVYYPFSIGMVVISPLIVFSKLKYVHTDFVGNIGAFLSVSFMISISILSLVTYSSNVAQRLLQVSSISNSSL